jgi:hypothetical protein
MTDDEPPWVLGDGDADAPLDRQVRVLERILARNASVQAILAAAPSLGLPDWYLGAGAVTGTVWNHLHGFAPGHAIKDYDLVYFDPDRPTWEEEAAVERQVHELFTELPIRIDVTNEARVHRWYPRRFGRTIDPYRSTGHAISTWPTTATSIGVRRDAGAFTICAPFGLRDLFAMVVRPNRALVSQEIYEAKATRWLAAWPRLDVHPW